MINFNNIIYENKDPFWTVYVLMVKYIEYYGLIRQINTTQRLEEINRRKIVGLDLTLEEFKNQGGEILESYKRIIIHQQPNIPANLNITVQGFPPEVISDTRKREERWFNQGKISEKEKTADELSKGFYLDFSKGGKKFVETIRILKGISDNFNENKTIKRKRKKRLKITRNIGNYDRQKFTNDIENQIFIK